VHTRDNSSGVILYAAIIFHTRMQSRIENNNVKAKKNNRFIDIYHLTLTYSSYNTITSYNTYLYYKRNSHKILRCVLC